jgi:hypothetical protein
MRKAHPFNPAIDWLEKLVDESPGCRALAKEEIQRLEKLKRTLVSLTNESEFESEEDFLARRGRLARTEVRRGKRDLNRKVYERIEELRQQGWRSKLRGDDIWEEVGKELNISGSFAKKCYNSHRNHTQLSWSETIALARKLTEEWEQSHAKKKGAV